MIGHKLLFSAQRIINITTNQVDYDLFAAVGSPVGVVILRVNIAPGVVISATTATYGADPAFSMIGFHPNSLIYLINEGHIIGMGGAGGVGQNVAGTSGTNGSVGGEALHLGCDVIIDNTSGYIWGGGGGGGGGGAKRCSGFEDVCGFGGGGGGGAGGGAGNTYGTGGSGCDWVGLGTAGSAGTGGTGGIGGAGGLGGDYDFGVVHVFGGFGGNGGTYGVVGQNGLDGTSTGTCSVPSNVSPTLGGAAGEAIHTDGFNITWRGGSGSPNVLGGVV